MTEKTKQLVNTYVSSAEIVSPVSLKFCIDPEWLELLITLDFIPGIKSVESLSDNTLRAYLGGKAKKSKVVVTLETLDEVINKELVATWRKRRPSRDSNIYLLPITVY